MWTIQYFIARPTFSGGLIRRAGDGSESHRHAPPLSGADARYCCQRPMIKLSVYLERYVNSLGHAPPLLFCKAGQGMWTLDLISCTTRSYQSLGVMSTVCSYTCTPLTHYLWGETVVVVTDHGHVMMMDNVVGFFEDLWLLAYLGGDYEAPFNSLAPSFLPLACLSRLYSFYRTTNMTSKVRIRPNFMRSIPDADTVTGTVSKRVQACSRGRRWWVELPPMIARSILLTTLS